MRFCVLASGSKGNAVYVAAGSTAILIDAGLSAAEITRRLAVIGVEPESLSAILITHEHSDHIRGAATLSRKWRLPVFANPATFSAAGRELDRLHAFREFTTGTCLSLNDLQVHPFSISHDSADPVGFVLSHGGFSLGLCTDTGMVTRLMRHHLSGCHALILESNHDPELLASGPYPPYLKQRVRSNRGHLANHEAAELLAELRHEALSHVVLAHLSETNNRPELALQSTMSQLSQVGPPPAISVASQHRPGEVVVLDRARANTVHFKK